MKREHLTASRILRAVCLLAVCSIMVGAVQAAEYLGPTAVVASPDEKTLYIVNTDARQVAVVDIASAKVVKSIAMPAAPTGLVFSPDDNTLYVTCAAPEGTVAVVDVKTGNVVDSIAAGHSAIGPAISPDGKTLYVCNRFDTNVSVIDVASKKELARVDVIREPTAAAITPDGKTVFVANHLPLDPADAYDVACSITAIDTATNEPTTIRLPNGSADMRGICVSPDGKYVYGTHILARYQMPTTQLERGWMNTNALSVIDAVAKKFVNTVLLDDVDLGAANPWGVTCTADSKTIVVSHAGTHEVSVIDATAMLEKLLAMPEEKDADNPGLYASATAADVPNDLAFLVGLRRRIRLDGGGPWSQASIDDPTANGPRGLVTIGSKAYVTAYFTDNVVAVDLEPKLSNLVNSIPLGPKPEITEQRRGEMLFNNAQICFQHWQSCASCHPDARADALNWDLMNDGLGNPKNASSMLLAHKTPPAMASGIRPNAEAAVRAGITHIQFAVRPEADAAAIDEYLKSLTPVPSPYLVDGKLSESAQRGKKLFDDEEKGCAKCHPAPLFTDGILHDVKSRGAYDRRDTFDTPTLVESWRTAPYMHDGHYTTMEQLLTEGKHADAHELSDEHRKDLIEYVHSL
ncbi:MAG: beta-propeller fold lactonase family protein [Thermoguttaceae bacterium]